MSYFVLFRIFLFYENCRKCKYGAAHCFVRRSHRTCKHYINKLVSPEASLPVYKFPKRLPENML